MCWWSPVFLLRIAPPALTLTLTLTLVTMAATIAIALSMVAGHACAHPGIAALLEVTIELRM